MTYKNKSFMTQKKAFTLIELLIVIAIIGILFIVLVSKVDFATDKAKATGVQTDFKSFQLAFDTVAKENAGFNTFGWDTGDANQNGKRDSYDEGDNGAGGGTANNGIQDGTEVFTGHKVYAETFTKVYSLVKPGTTGYDRDALNRLETAINANLDPKLHITIKDDGEIVMANGAKDPWNKEYHGYYISNAENDGKDRGAIVMYSDGANNEFGSEHKIANGIVSISIPGSQKSGKDDYSIVSIYTYVNGYGEVLNMSTGFSNNQNLLSNNVIDATIVPDDNSGNEETPDGTTNINVKPTKGELVWSGTEYELCEYIDNNAFDFLEPNKGYYIEDSWFIAGYNMDFNIAPPHGLTFSNGNNIFTIDNEYSTHISSLSGNISTSETISIYKANGGDPVKGNLIATMSEDEFHCLGNRYDGGDLFFFTAGKQYFVNDTYFVAENMGKYIAPPENLIIRTREDNIGYVSYSTDGWSCVLSNAPSNDEYVNIYEASGGYIDYENKGDRYDEVYHDPSTMIVTDNGILELTYRCGYIRWYNIEIFDNSDMVNPLIYMTDIHISGNYDDTMALSLKNLFDVNDATVPNNGEEIYIRITADNEYDNPQYTLSCVWQNTFNSIQTTYSKGDLIASPLVLSEGIIENGWTGFDYFLRQYVFLESTQVLMDDIGLYSPWVGTTFVGHDGRQYMIAGIVDEWPLIGIKINAVDGQPSTLEYINTYKANVTYIANDGTQYYVTERRTYGYDFSLALEILNIVN